MMHFRKPSIFRQLWYSMTRLLRHVLPLASLLLFALPAFSHVAEVVAADSSARSPRRNQVRAAADTSVFAAAARWVKAEGFVTSEEMRRYPLRIDPRPFHSLSDSGLVEADTLVLDYRKAVLRHSGVLQRDALSYNRNCVMKCDPRLTKREEADRVECPAEKCKFTVVAMSLPVNHEVEKAEQEVQQERGVKTIKVFRLTAFSFYVYRLTFQYTDRGWSMIDKERVAGGAM